MIVSPCHFTSISLIISLMEHDHQHLVRVRSHETIICAVDIAINDNHHISFGHLQL